MKTGYKCPAWKRLKDKVRPEIKEFARDLRRNQTKHEKLLWERLRGRKVYGLRFRRQSVVRGYIVDFYCPEHRLAIELDGKGHSKEKDAIRDRRIWEKCRITVLRFPNLDVENKMPEVIESIRIKCGLGDFPTNPQTQQQQDLVVDCSLPKKLGRPCDDDEHCGNVEKPVSALNTEDLALAKLCERNVNSVDFGVRPLLGCRRQSFASLEVAESTARILAKIGITALPERCKMCRMIHLKETR